MVTMGCFDFWFRATQGACLLGLSSGGHCDISLMGARGGLTNSDVTLVTGWSIGQLKLYSMMTFSGCLLHTLYARTSRLLFSRQR